MGEFVNRIIEINDYNMGKPVVSGVVLFIYLLIISILAIKRDKVIEDYLSNRYYVSNSRNKELGIVFVFSALSILVFLVDCSSLMITALRLIVFLIMQLYIYMSIGIIRSIVFAAGSLGIRLCLRFFMGEDPINNWYADTILVAVLYILSWICGLLIIYSNDKTRLIIYILIFIFVGQFVVPLSESVIHTRISSFAIYYANEHLCFGIVMGISWFVGAFLGMTLHSFLNDKFSIGFTELLEQVKLPCNLADIGSAETKKTDIFRYTYTVFSFDKYEECKAERARNSNKDKDDIDNKINACHSDKDIELKSITDAIEYISKR